MFNKLFILSATNSNNKRGSIIRIINFIFNTFDKLKNKLANFFSSIFSAYGSAVKRGYKTNAFSPFAWFAFFLIVVFLSCMLFTNNVVIQYTLLVLIVIIAVFGCVFILLIFYKDPKLLQSEKYRIEDKRLDIVAQKGGEIETPSVTLIHDTNIGGQIENE